MMTRIEQLAMAVLEGDGLLARSLAQDFLREMPCMSDVPRPSGEDARTLVVCAALVELFASRMKQQSPEWTQRIGSLTEPVYLVQAATKMKNLRALCDTQSPEPLRKHGLYAPPNYLEFA
jgi:hypothetical protein